MSVAACGTSESSATKAPSANEAFDTAVKGGSQSDIPVAEVTPAASGPVDRVTWGLQYEPSSLDSMVSYAQAENIVVSNITESLLRIMPDFSLEPSLAESWETPDDTTYVFKLRSDVKFSDGEPMTADDVVHSLNRNRGESSFWAMWLTKVKSVEKSGENEVTVKLVEPDALFLQVMALPAGGVNQKAAVAKAGKSYGTSKGLPVATGPYKAESWSQGSKITLAINEHYWDTESAPKAGKIEFSFIEDPSAMVNALESGAIDGTYSVPFPGVPTLQKSSTGKLYQGKSMLQAVAFFTEKKGSPFQNPKLRYAWLKAIDRAGIAQKVFNGAATPMADTFMPPATWASDVEAARDAYAKLGQPEVDLEGAKKLVEEAGGPPKETLLIAYANDPQSEAMVTIAQAAGKAIGLDMKLERVSPADFTNLIFSREARAKYDAWITDSYYSDVADPLELMVEFLEPVDQALVSYNFNEYDNPEVTKLLKAARQEMDPKKRTSTLLEIQAIISPEVPVLPLVVPASLVFLNNKISGAPASFVWEYYPWARDLGAA